MAARMELQCSGPRWDNMEDVPLDNEDRWRYRSKKSWVSTEENFKVSTVEKALSMLDEALLDPDHSLFGTTHGVWRLVYYPHGGTNPIRLSDGRVVDLGRVIAAGPLRQGVDAGKVDHAAAHRAIFGTEVSEESPLTVLSDTPVPAGTVVEILDEWGLPTGSTEVT